VRRVIREIGRVLVENRVAVVRAPLVRNDAEQLGTEIRGDGHAGRLGAQ
jgi:hypothetical protein